MPIQTPMQTTPLPSSLERLMPILRCPDCGGGPLEATRAESLRCTRCGMAYPVVGGVPFLLEAGLLCERLVPEGDAGKLRPRSEHYSKGGEYHWREYGIADLLPDATTARRILLVGCGDGGEIPFLEARGHEIVAFDIHRSPGTDFVADAHRIPLEDGSVDLVLSMQVLEHLHSPWLAMDEIGRVLRPGGWFVGSVAFLKGYHGSYFHMTHLGVTSLLDRAGLEVDYFAGAQSLTYTLYGALLPLGTRPMRRAILGAVDRILGWARATIWSATRHLDPNLPSDRFHTRVPMSFRAFDRLRFAPAVVFRARKAG